MKIDKITNHISFENMTPRQVRRVILAFAWIVVLTPVVMTAIFIFLVK